MREKYFQKAETDKCSAWIPLFSFAFGKDSVSKVHNLELEISRPNQGLAKSAIYTVYWPIKAFLIAMSAAVNFEKEAHKVELSYWRIFLLFWRLLVRHNMTIESCNKYRIWRPENLARVNEYIQFHEIIALVPWLSRHKNTSQLDDKIQFAELCQKNSLPTAEIVATLKNGKINFNSGRALPKKDLFSKINGSWGGSNGQTWIYDEVLRSWSNRNVSYDELNLCRHLTEIAPSATTVIQVLLRNGAEIESFSSGALCTIRVVTFKLPGESPQLFRAALRMPVGGSDVDNYGAGGLAAGIDGNGRLTSATRKKDRYGYIEIHPDTGTQITGATVECLHQVVELAMHAHTTLTDVYSVGWDIAWTQYGAVIVEANVGWDEAVLQMPESRPLGKPFCELFEAVREAE